MNNRAVILLLLPKRAELPSYPGTYRIDQYPGAHGSYSCSIKLKSIPTHMHALRHTNNHAHRCAQNHAHNHAYKEAPKQTVIQICTHRGHLFKFLTYRKSFYVVL